MTQTLPHLLRSCLLALVTLALLSVPFAHRAGTAPATSQMTQFLAMGGDIADICGETGGHLTAGCESCRIVGAMLLPSLGQIAIALDFPTLSQLDRGTLSIVILAVTYTHPPVRGPPRV